MVILNITDGSGGGAGMVNYGARRTSAKAVLEYCLILFSTVHYTFNSDSSSAHWLMVKVALRLYVTIPPKMLCKSLQGLEVYQFLLMWYPVQFIFFCLEPFVLILSYTILQNDSVQSTS
jgi:hypothetical protein